MKQKGEIKKIIENIEIGQKGEEFMKEDYLAFCRLLEAGHKDISLLLEMWGELNHVAKKVLGEENYRRLFH